MGYTSLQSEIEYKLYFNLLTFISALNWTLPKAHKLSLNWIKVSWTDIWFCYNLYYVCCKFMYFPYVWMTTLVYRTDEPLTTGCWRMAVGTGLAWNSYSFTESSWLVFGRASRRRSVSSLTPTGRVGSFFAGFCTSWIRFFNILLLTGWALNLCLKGAKSTVSKIGTCSILWQSIVN